MHYLAIIMNFKLSGVLSIRQYFSIAYVNWKKRKSCNEIVWIPPKECADKQTLKNVCNTIPTPTSASSYQMNTMQLTFLVFYVTIQYKVISLPIPFQNKQIFIGYTTLCQNVYLIFDIKLIHLYVSALCSTI